MSKSPDGESEKDGDAAPGVPEQVVSDIQQDGEEGEGEDGSKLGGQAQQKPEPSSCARSRPVRFRELAMGLLTDTRTERAAKFMVPLIFWYCTAFLEPWATKGSGTCVCVFVYARDEHCSQRRTDTHSAHTRTHKHTHTHAQRARHARTNAHKHARPDKTVVPPTKRKHPRL